MKKMLLTLENISKSYGKQLVLNDVTFSVQEGEICGLVGENGAGKTTLIRIISGLITSDSGRIAGLDNRDISVIVESPALYPRLSAQDNLRVQLISLGLDASGKKIEEVLNRVGLSQVDSGKKVKDFSLGMRQRLAIALAICDNPKLLILDEPINGLDPVGIKEMRDILLSLKKDLGMTILVSSHILAELELVVDQYVIMSKGQILKVINKKDLQVCLKSKRIFYVSPNHRAIALLNQKGIQLEVESNGFSLPEEGESTSQIIDYLRLGNIQIEEIMVHRPSFESYYLSLISEE